MSHSKRRPGFGLILTIDLDRVVRTSSAQQRAERSRRVVEDSAVHQHAVLSDRKLEAQRVGVRVGRQFVGSRRATVGNEHALGQFEARVAGVRQAWRGGLCARTNQLRGTRRLAQHAVVEQRDSAIRVDQGHGDALHAPDGGGQVLGNVELAAAGGEKSREQVRQHQQVVHRRAFVVAAVGQDLAQ